MTGEQAAAAAALVALYDERVDLAAAMAEHASPTRAMATAVLEKGAELDQACEAFRRRFFPRRYQVIVGLRQVMVCSATRRSVTTVYRPATVEAVTS